MGTPRPWTDAESDTLRQLHAQGKSLTEAAKIMGRGKATLSNKSPALGINWDRTQTAAATEAKVEDARSRRATLQLGLLADAERLRTQVWAPTMAFNFGGKDNTYEEHQLDQPTFSDQLKIMQAVSIAIDRSLKLDLHDSGEGNAHVVGLLQRTAAALGLTDHTDVAPPAE